MNNALSVSQAEEFVSRMPEGIASPIAQGGTNVSGGQKQRVSISRAIINEPAIMLADEPTGNLDSKASEEIISLLRLSNKKYKQTLIVITHDEKIALEADRIITIDDGRIIKDERNG